ncbi:MAG TPA: ArsB/NhaD family transporter [Mycobacterium sp.]|uniref:SLC13 family permease n=1 Tax=Mycolicibacterium sp. TaxID=2320850 RepID=UPI0025FF21DD|nr:SLC13 family permease [Mycolicibacterium sp.]HPX37092.1 ArsB/NhaD family transporter [Mycobacterium sp.]HQC77517.1 ArsB/NhaD family transporter [Mycobacterium sp.]
MTGTLLVALGLLALVLVSATSRWSEVAVAVPAAGLLVGIGAVSTQDAAAELQRLAPVVGFLAAVLLLAGLCDDEGLFRAAGVWAARSSGGSPRRLFGRVFLVATGTTAVLSLDATVVLLTPVVLETVRAMKVPARPHVYSTAHLANTASLPLPVSNLTNLLAFAVAGLSFARFSTLMVAPWLVAVAVEYVVFRWAFRSDLADRTGEHPLPPAQPIPVFPLVVLALTLAGFVATSFVGLSPAWAALAGALVLAVRSMVQGRSTIGGMAHSLNIPFLAFVLALGVVVKAVLVNGADVAVRQLLPSGDGLAALLLIAVLAAGLSNLVNNLPAILLLLPLLTGPGPVLAALIGVNIGPNLTYVGSLSNLLWRRIMHQRGEPTSAALFTRLGLLTVPAGLLVAVLALWAGLAVTAT